MIGVVVYVHNPLNFDVAFPYNKLEKAQSEKTVYLSTYDKELDLFSERVECPVYRVRLRGLSRRDLKLKDGMQKHRLLLKLNRSNCVVLVTVNSIDSYGRIEADLQDPVQKFSYATWLLKKYPDVYYQYRTRTR